MTPHFSVFAETMGCVSSQYFQQLSELKDIAQDLEQDTTSYYYNLVEQASLQRITLNLSVAKSKIQKIEAAVIRLNNNDLLANFYNEYANILINQQNYLSSLKKYKLAEQYATANNHLLLPIQVNIVQNWLEILNDPLGVPTKKDINQAWHVLQQTVDLLQKQPQTEQNINLRLHLSQIALQLYHSSFLISERKKALFSLSFNLIKNIQTQDLRQKSYVFGYLAKLYELQARYPEAISLTLQAIQLAQQIQTKTDNHILYLWQAQLGQLRELTYKPDLAITAYQQAIFHFNRIRSIVLTTNHSVIKQEKFYQVQGQVYFRLINLLIQKSQSTQSKAQQQCYLAQTSQLFELFNQGELEEYYKDECLSERHFAKVSTDLLLTNCQDIEENKQISLFHNRKDFSKFTAILYFFKLNEEKLGIILHLSTRIIFHTIDVKKLSYKRRSFVTSIKSPPINKHKSINKIVSKQLYQYLIKPISQQLEFHNIDTLLVISHDDLRTIPFAALHDGEHFLVERYATVILPFLPKDPFKEEGKEHHILLSALTEGDNKLDNAENEIEAIQQYYKNYQRLNGQNFTKENILRMVKDFPYSRIHFATHGKFKDRADKSYLQTFKQNIQVNDLKNINMMNSFRDNPLDLLTLSACETSVNTSQAALGFSGIAIQAGAKTALGSLWQVSDLSTCYLMESFYENLQTMPKAQALQKAQIELLTGNIKPKSYCLRQDLATDFQSPYYWSGFQLIGHWK